jgi:hypothetical protein
MTKHRLAAADFRRRNDKERRGGTALETVSITSGGDNAFALKQSRRPCHSACLADGQPIARITGASAPGRSHSDLSQTATFARLSQSAFSRSCNCPILLRRLCVLQPQFCCAGMSSSGPPHVQPGQLAAGRPRAAVVASKVLDSSCVRQTPSALARRLPGTDDAINFFQLTPFQAAVKVVRRR